MPPLLRRLVSSHTGILGLVTPHGSHRQACLSRFERGHANCSGTNGRSTPSTSEVTISSNRLDEFVQHELNFFAARVDRPLQPLSLKKMLQAGAHPNQVSKLLHKELPVRFARRLRLIERLVGWEQIPELCALHAMHAKSFRELRLADPVKDAAAYPGVIGRIRHRHKRIGPLFAEAMLKIDSMLPMACPDTGTIGIPYFGGSIDADPTFFRLERTSVERWAEIFLSSRVSTEITMSHYAVCLGAWGSGDSGDKMGIIDFHSDPFEICQQAVAQVEDGPFACMVDIENPCGHIRFCHSPRYLFYIVVELLQNCARATAESTGLSESLAEGLPISVAVCANERQVVIRISDRGGGMCLRHADQIWSFVGKGSKPKGEVVASALAEELDDDDSQLSSVGGAVERPWAVFSGLSPLSGRGIGLPLSRLYAKYLGGSLEVVNLPGLGVDAFLILPRIDVSDIHGNLSEQ